MEMNAEIKALLVSIGGADIDESLLREVAKTTIPSAGPGAGLESFFIKSGNHRVRLSVNRGSPLKVIGCRGEVSIVKGGESIVTGQLELALCHCPEQAYITMSGRCIYDCKFCPVPILRGKIRNPQEILKMIEEADKSGNLKAISLTSGVAESPQREAGQAAQVVRLLRKHYDLPIGISIYPTETSSEELYASGATEIKYNVETMDPSIFGRCCPGLSLQDILKSLGNAVEIFGKNNVSSNFIIGLGESDNCVHEGTSHLAEMGVIPILRPISPHPLRSGEINIHRPSPYRLIHLARIARRILDDHGLRADLAKTMCLPCTGCDITPHRDV